MKWEMGQARPADGSVSLGKVRAKNCAGQHWQEMALFPGLFAGADFSPDSNDVRIGTEVCDFVNHNAPSAHSTGNGQTLGLVSYLSPVANASISFPIDHSSGTNGLASPTGLPNEG